MSRSFEEPDAGAEFSYSRWSIVSMWIDVVFSFFVSCLLVVIATYGIGGSGRPIIWVGIIGGYYAAFVLLCRNYLYLKYLYIFRTRYVVGYRGISVGAGAERRLIKWDELTSSDYLSLIPAYRFSYAGQTRPVVLFMIGDLFANTKTNRRNQLATDILRENLGSRLKTRWFPW